MTRTLEKLTDEVKALPDDQLEEFLAWLSDFETERMDAWDGKLASDSRPGGRLQDVISRAQEDINSGKTKPLDELIDNR
jgi:hypothetical protein